MSKLTDLSVFQYTDFRKFLGDVTSELKKDKKYFNHSYIAKRAGLKSPGYIKMIVDGNRNLTTDMFDKFCEVLEITGKEKSYFEVLVAYNQESNPDRKKSLFEDLMHLRPRAQRTELSEQHRKYFTKPYYACVREIVTLKEFKEDPDWIAKRCYPPIKVSEAKEALETLLEIGFLKRDSKNHLVQTESYIQTRDHDNQILETHHAHDEILSLTREALIQIKQEDRHFYALTLALPQEKFKEVVDQFYKFRDTLVSIIESTTPGENDEVFQANFQFFPRTKLEK